MSARGGIQAVRAGRGFVIGGKLSKRAVTVLFTDIVRSTALLQRLKDRSALAMFEAHFDLVRKQIERHGAISYAEPTGDSIKAEFESPKEAVACAAAIQQAQRRHNLGHPDQSLQVRIGLGQASRTEPNREARGLDVHLAHRAVERAEADQILAAPAGLERAGSVAGTRFVDRGEFKLKHDEEGSLRLSEVVWTNDAGGFVNDFGLPGEDAVALLGRLAPEFLTIRRAEELELYTDTLMSLNLRGHLWAQLLAHWVQYIVGIDRGNEELRRVFNGFRRKGDAVGQGFTAWALSQIARGSYDWQGSIKWASEAIRLLGSDSPLGVSALGLLVLADYHQGHLSVALERAVSAAASARSSGVRSHEFVANEAASRFYEAFIATNVGDFRQAEGAVKQSDELFETVQPPQSRYLQPLVHGLRASISCLRGQYTRARPQFKRALSLAYAYDISWYKVFILAARAELTASQNPVAALEDAQRALRISQADPDPWPMSWARRSHAVASVWGEGGERLKESVETLENLLTLDLGPVEQGRTLVALGEIQLGERRRKAQVLGALSEARDLLEAVGAHYWWARASYLLAQVDQRNAVSLLLSASQTGLREFDHDDPAYKALRKPYRGPL
jgi:class 3 adenylate cyclase/tetratricopeptide (TPR) repeat protein